MKNQRKHKHAEAKSGKKTEERHVISRYRSNPEARFLHILPDVEETLTAERWI